VRGAAARSRGDGEVKIVKTPRKSIGIGCTYKFAASCQVISYMRSGLSNTAQILIQIESGLLI
jgi:hypothetical protein